MKILVVDDEQLQLDKLTEAIREVVPEAEIVMTQRPSEALMYVEDDDFDIAFLDINMRGMTGIELAQLLKRVSFRLNIIFVTAYTDFKSYAMDLRASGYITKPVNAEKVREELMNLRYPIPSMNLQRESIAEDRSDNWLVKSSILQGSINHSILEKSEISLSEVRKEESAEADGPLLYIQCFGNFDVFDRNHKPLKFARNKAKEMLAYLVFRRGSRCTNREIASILYENVEYNNRVQDSFRHVSSALTKALRQVGAEKAVIKEHHNYALDKSLVDCDYYRFIEDPDARINYTGDFMAQYSWGEYINGYLDSQL